MQPSDSTTNSSRQRRWQDRCRDQGLCPHCGKEPLIPGRSRGAKCLIKEREKMRQRGNSKRRNTNAASYQIGLEGVS